MKLDQEFTQVSRKRGMQQKDSHKAKMKAVETLTQPSDVIMCPPTISDNVDASVMPQPKQVVPRKCNYLYSDMAKSPYLYSFMCI